MVKVQKTHKISSDGALYCSTMNNKAHVHVLSMSLFAQLSTVLNQSFLRLVISDERGWRRLSERCWVKCHVNLTLSLETKNPSVKAIIYKQKAIIYKQNYKKNLIKLTLVSYFYLHVCIVLNLTLFVSATRRRRDIKIPLCLSATVSKSAIQ